MDLWKSMSGMVTLEFTSAVPEKTMEALVQGKIALHKVVRKDPLTYQILIRRRDCRRLSEILNHRGDHWKLVQRQGIYWTVSTLLHRPVLMILVLVLLLSSIVLPSRIFFVSVDGNIEIPDRFILSAAENCGIRFGASRKLVRSEKVKNALLSAVPQLQWAGVNTYGCTAVISVREQTEKKKISDHSFASSLIADRDGYVLTTTVTSGTSHVFPGDAVTKGQLLISGYTDSGICIRASKAAGEVLALTERKLAALMPQKYLFPVHTGNTKYSISLLIGKKRINLWKDSSFSDASCGRMYTEYFVSLPGGFQLPVGFSVDQQVEYVFQEQILAETSALCQLQHFSENYMTSQMIAGQILRSQQNQFCSDGFYRLESRFTCTEMIGRERREEIGVLDGKGN